jgi:NAD(P)-dependent dehydrogenase (short-subunit alcohol dehydrogenase family)
MQEFTGKVAVVTGAASGIGRALAERSAREGMKVVLADVEKPALARAAVEMQASGATVLAVPTDVSRLADIENLARRTVETFGAVHLLFNNAGVGVGGPPWECTEADWQWTLGVNLWGVIHGLRVFLPIMMAQGTEGHIVNTASAAGILPFHPSAPYQTTKFAVVGLSENLHHWLALAGSPLKASVLCPGWIKTHIMESERNRPAELRNPPAAPPPPEVLAQIAAVAQLVETGLAPEAVADGVFSAIREEKFYIYVGLEPFMALVEQRNHEVLQARNPAMPVFR